ncbi:MAG: hypothetical protein OXI96_01170 [Acidimicrobiaceae bacterium]|nr:hypothetical protein [Acidimicrobiaceae bacterium]
MNLGFVAEVVTLAMAMLAIIWNQQRTTNGLRGELRGEMNDLRGEMNEANRELRGEMNGLRGEVRQEIIGLRGEMNEANRELRGSIKKLGDGLAENGQRLARIEGHLGIEVLSTTASGTTSPELAIADGVALAGKTEVSPTVKTTVDI